MSDIKPAVPAGYADFLAEIKQRILTAQLRAALAVKSELVLLYWSIGRDILVRQGRDGWGARVIERLSKDLRSVFPEMQGLSPRNLGYMKAFAKAWPEVSILQASLAKITWYHNLTLLEKVTSSAERLTNFETALPAPQSDLAQQILKDPYNFDFLTLTNEAQERDLERGLLAHLRQFLIELGVGFSFAGSQVPLEVGGEDFKLDLLFYHFKLRGLRGYRSKDGSVQARVCGLWNFYLSAVHDLLATRMTSRATATLWPRVATLWMWNSTFKDMSLASGWMRLGPRVQCG